MTSAPDRLTDATGAELHVFDVDHTLTRHSTGRRFARAGIDLGVFRTRDFLSMPWFYLRYRLGRLSLDDITREIRVITGMPRTRLEGVANHCWEHYVQHDIFPAARAHLDRCRASGGDIVLLSTSFALVLNPLAHALAVDDVIASQLEWCDDRATGWLIGGPCYAEEKARRLDVYLREHGLTADRVAFYSDSFHDLPTLEMVGHPVAVNPDPVLTRRARRRHWPIVRWY